jgi:glycosyltransferase involved in cell wall biosynthesis
MRCEYNALKKADACVLVSKQVGIELENAMGCKSATQYIVHNIIDEKTCIERAKESCEEPRKTGISRIVSVGRVTPAKGFDIICPTAKILAEHDANFEWYIIGDGEDREKLIRHVKENKLQEYVHFIGNKPNPMPWVNSADVIVQPSIFESWGMTITEALCLGKAIVASDLPVFKEQISDGVNGLLRPNIPSVLAETIADVLSNADLRYKLESKAKSNLVTKEMVIDEFNTMIDKLIMQY